MTGSFRSHMISRATVFIAVLICTVGLSFGQQSSFQASASKTTVAVGEKFRVEYKFNVGGDRFDQPDFQGFRVLAGPNQSSMTQNINGKVSHTISVSYVLMPMSVGNFTIQPASLKVGSDVIQSNPLTIKVLKEVTSDNSSNENNLDKNVFIRASTNNSSPYVGQQIIISYKLYFNQQLGRSYNTLMNPSLDGFWLEDIDISKEQPKTEVVNGIRYNTILLKKSLLIPQRSGDLELDPFQIEIAVYKPRQSRSRNLMDEIFGQNVDAFQAKPKSQAYKIAVKPLPSPKPASFSGAVGNFTVNFKADRNEVKSNEAINIEYEISGQGNLKLLNKPDISFPSDFEVYDPKVSDRINSNAGGMSGIRTYNYLCIPRHKGEFTVEGPEFSYFDPNKKKYLTLKSKDINFKIEKGDDDEAAIVGFSKTNKEDIKFLGSDIRYIMTTTTLLNVGYSFFGSILYYILWLLPIPLFILAYFIKRKFDEKRKDSRYMQRSRANKMAVKRLSLAKKLMSNGDDKAFYEEVFKALYGFFGDKFNLNTSEISKDRITEVLESSSINQELIEKTLNILNQCEMARFAPTSDVDREKVYADSIGLLSEIQKNLK